MFYGTSGEYFENPIPFSSAVIAMVSVLIDAVASVCDFHFSHLLTGWLLVAWSQHQGLPHLPGRSNAFQASILVIGPLLELVSLVFFVCFFTNQFKGHLFC